MRSTSIKDYLNPGKIIYCFAEKLGQYMTGERAFAPWSVEIHPTSKCNYNCVFCSYKERNEKGHSLDRGVMDKLVDSLISLGVKGVYFSGGGESSMYPGIAQYIEKLSVNGVEAAMITNGSYLRESGIIDIAHMLNYISISIPSVIPDKYIEITGSSKLETVLSVPSEVKQTHGGNSPVVGCRIVVNSLNLDEIEQMLHELRTRRFDYALFKIVRDYEDSGLGLKAEEEQKLKKTIKALNEDVVDDRFTNLNDLFAYKAEVTKTTKCYVNEMGLLAVVDSDGSVYPNIVEIGDSEFCAGNLCESSLETIWHGDKHMKVKEASNDKCLEGRCKNCRAVAYNKIISDIVAPLPPIMDSFV